MFGADAGPSNLTPPFPAALGRDQNVVPLNQSPDIFCGRDTPRHAPPPASRAPPRQRDIFGPSPSHGCRGGG